ncbi:unnamed protein product [Durusdinium trenchii]|uniref:Uncharacterized protein n=2 Tax=Durusdinium trenchii TaxID=1381693 RepID=A0ABP0NJW0_9DINO
MSVECELKLGASTAVILDPRTTLGAHRTTVDCLYIAGGSMFLMAIFLLYKLVRQNLLSDTLFLLFFILSALGWILMGLAGDFLVAGENWATKVAKVLITLSWAFLLLNCCCVLEGDLLQKGARNVMWVSTIFVVGLSLAASAAKLGEDLQGIMFFATMLSWSCTMGWAVAHHFVKVEDQEYCMKAFFSFVAGAGTLTAAILEPLCGYAGHSNCYEECFGTPGVHVLIWLVPTLGSYMGLCFCHHCCPDKAVMPPIFCGRTTLDPTPPPDPPKPPEPEPPEPVPCVV